MLLLTGLSLVALSGALQAPAPRPRPAAIVSTGKDEEIFEASFDTALFAFFNRMADAYGLDYPTGGWLSPEKRRGPEHADR